MTGWRRWAPLLTSVLLLTTLMAVFRDAGNRRRDARLEALQRLKVEARHRARQLETRLGRAFVELRSSAEGMQGGSPPSWEALAGRVSDHLADLEEGFWGVLVVDPDGRPLLGDPGAVPGATELFPGSSEGVVLHTGLALPQGRAGAALSLRLPEEVRGEGATLSLVVSLELEPGPSAFQAYAGLPPTLLLLDQEGVILSHPRREWLGDRILTPQDSLYDLELWRILPGLMGEEEGAWSMVSEILSEGSWARARSSLLAASPVRVPTGETWHLGLMVTPGEGGLPGSPSLARTAGLAALLMLLAAGITLGIPAAASTIGRMKRAEAGERWFRTLVEAGPDGMLILDEVGHIVTANPAFLRVAGRPAAEVEGRPLEQLLERWGEGAEPPGPIHVPQGFGELRVLGPTGEAVDLEMSAAEVTLDQRRYTVVQTRDPGPRRRAERETLKVGERERLQLGKELHDGLGQHLSGVAFMAKTLARKLVDRGSVGADEALRISHLLKEAVGQVRILSRGLELAEHDCESLPGALEEMSGVVRRLMGVDLEVDFELGPECGEGTLDSFRATQIYRLCHELVSVAVRGQLARKVRVGVRRSGDRIRIEVRHDGRSVARSPGEGGADPEYRLRYRARLLDAALEVRENRGGGTVTTCSFHAGAKTE